ncbi:integrase [Pasteurellaceae bacterium LFhippo2]|nr:integrase [Pasteurellaceae bacterium LFhippo2]
MARTAVKPLTDTKIKNLSYSPNSKPIPDGNGLFILTQKKSKVWIFSYVHPVTKARSTKNRIGFYPTMSLFEARQKCFEFQNLLNQGIDPFEHLEKQRKEQERQAETIESFAEKWAEWKLSKGKFSEKTKKKALNRLKNHLFPRFPNYTLNQFTITDAIEKLSPMEFVLGDTLDRVCGSLIEILDYAVLCGIIPSHPIGPIKKAFAFEDSEHQPTIPPEKLPDFMKALQKSNRSPQTKLLVEFQLVTMLRPFEAVAVQWSDIDWEKKLLTIPAERMKGGKHWHNVPLSKQALAILEEMKCYNGHCQHVFAGRVNRTKPANSQTANNAIKKLDRGAYKGILTAHGMRSIASTYLNDKYTSEPLVIEVCLSHVGTDETRKAYYHGSYLKRRYTIMQAWGNYVDKCKKG